MPKPPYSKAAEMLGFLGLLILLHLLELFHAEDAITVRVVLGKHFLFVNFVTCRLIRVPLLILLAFLENEVVQSQVFVVELADDLKTP